MLSEEPLRFEEVTVRVASDWLAALRAGGGTQLYPGLKAMLEQPREPDHHLMFVILTDGAFDDEPKIPAVLEELLGDGRVFIVGIGEDVKREAILRLAQYGRGTAAFAADAADLESTVATLFDSIAEPLAWDLAIDWGGAEVEMVEPQRLPDLYSGMPVTVQAKVRGALPSQVSLKAQTTTGEREFSVVLLEPVAGASPQLPRRAPREKPRGESPRRRR